MEDGFCNRAGWQILLDREGLPVSSASIGLLRREDFVARRGTLLLWRRDGEGSHADLREYSGVAGDDVALLLVADAETLASLREGGWAQLSAWVRQGRLQPYILKTMDELEAAGLSEFIEELGLVFPRH